MTSAILLAAGASSRMGRPKALLAIEGRPAVERVVETLRSGGADDVIVVVGRHSAEIRAGADLRSARVVENPRWEEGRTSSVQVGIAALPPGADAALLALVDMPFVRSETVRALLDAFRGAKPTPEVVVPVHDSRNGHPILLARSLFPRIAALGPDAPLHLVIRAAERIGLPVDDPGVLIDLDTPSDAARPCELPPSR